MYIIDFTISREREEGRLTSRHGSVEFLTTMPYIEKYLKSGDKVLEIGAGTGRYSHIIARKGYLVDAVELVESNIEVFHQNTQSGERITVTQANAMDLHGFSDNTYDITLVLGPMYHLYNMEDKRQAMREAIRMTKQDEIVFVAYCMSDPSVLIIHSKTFEASSAPELIFEVVKKEQIDAIMHVFNVERLSFIATDLYTNHIPDEIDVMDEKTFSLYLSCHFAVCERSDMIGLSGSVRN